MRNSYKIIWSDEALTNLKNIINYLENNWSQKETSKFARLLEKRINLITKNPFLFPESNILNGIRRSVLSKQITIYYRITESQIRIITLFDNRQNLKRLKTKK
jgi:plasmid stabilization system protein ParE